MAKNDDERVFDVAKPGKSEPSSTSRPVIVGHKKMIDDPMVTPSASATLDSKKNGEQSGTLLGKPPEEQSLAPHEGKSVVPISSETTEHSGSSTPQKDSATPDAKTPENTETDKDKPVPDETVPDAVESSKKTDKTNAADKLEQMSQEEKARQAATQKLIESKAYVVHIGEVKQRRNVRLILIGLGGAGLIAVITIWLLMSS